MESIDEVIARAMERGARAASREPMAINARFDANARRLFIELAGNVEFSIPADQLGFPQGADLSGVRVEGGGFDLYFPVIDEGAFVPDLARAAIEHRLAARTVASRGPFNFGRFRNSQKAMNNPSLAPFTYFLSAPFQFRRCGRVGLTCQRRSFRGSVTTALRSIAVSPAPTFVPPRLAVPWRSTAPNPAVDPVRFALWTLRDEAAQRRSPPR